MDMVRAVLKALIFTLCTAVTLLLVASAIALAAPDPDAVSGMLGVATIIISSLAGGIAAARIDIERPLSVAIPTVAVYLLLHMAVRLILGDGQGSFISILITYIGAVAAAVLGALIARPHRSKGSKGVRRFKKYSKKMRA